MKNKKTSKHLNNIRCVKLSHKSPSTEYSYLVSNKQLDNNRIIIGMSTAAPFFTAEGWKNSVSSK